MTGEERKPNPASVEEEGGEEELRWLWKASEDTKLCQYANDFGTRIGMTVVTLTTSRPLEFPLFKRAFRIAQSKCLNLRMTLRSRGNDLWFCELLKPSLDVEELDENEDLFEVIERLSKQDYNCKNQPHWRIRLTPRKQGSSNALENSKKDFPFQYDYIFQMNHILFDGMNLALVVDMAHKIFDRLIEGESNFDGETGYGYTENTGLEERERDVELKLLEEEEYRELIAREMPLGGRIPWINRGYPKPGVRRSSTKHITRQIGRELLQKLSIKCKEAGVTFNSAFTAIINVSLMQLMRSAGVDEDSYDIYSYQLVNLRRYLDHQEKTPAGAYHYPMTYHSRVDAADKENFWEYAKKCNEELQSKLKAGRPFEQKVFKRQKKNVPTTPSEFFDDPPPVLLDFSVSNVGDLTRLVPGEGRHVRVTRLRPFNIIHDYLHMNMHQVATYKGESQYTLSYDTSYLTDEVADAFVGQIFLVMDDVL